jgi:uncharacterized protein (TIGR03643 family)
VEVTAEEVNRVVQMAWEDRTPFDAIKMQFGLSEQQVIALMRQQLKPSSWRLWRARVNGRKTKHHAIATTGRFKSNQQRAISNNKISKRGSR